jgi:hypothetical protein
VQMKNWLTRFPTILQRSESTIEMLRGQYAHSVGCFDEAAFHFLEALKVFSPLGMPLHNILLRISTSVPCTS